MTRHPPLMPAEDYEAIEAAVMDTARGRWFLAEYARRNRTADTQVLLDAIERIEALIATAPDTERAPQAALPPPQPEPVADILPVEPNVEIASAEPDEPSAPPPVLDSEWGGSADTVVEIHNRMKNGLSLVDAELFDQADEVMWAPLAEPENDSETVVALVSVVEVMPVPVVPRITPPPTEPDLPGPPAGASPPLVDPADLDLLSFEQKSVYFA